MSASASAISEIFALALMCLKKSCALARAHNLTSARSQKHICNPTLNNKKFQDIGHATATLATKTFTSCMLEFHNLSSK